MTLFEGVPGRQYAIEGMFIENAANRRLEALGMNEGTMVNIITRKRSGALIVKVRGTRLAIGKQISSGIEVKEATDNE